MKEDILFEIKALYRDDFRVKGYTFGHGKKALCIVGSLRGNENQQLYACSLLVKKLKKLEEEGRIADGKEILVIPCANPYSMNIKKRFWSIDNTDINRMFPGYNEGETTQRIADGIFKNIKDYEYGIQFASFYMPGAFVPHVRIMKYLDYVELAKEFGLPYVILHDVRPFDTTTLNYNWQIWETKAFSIYTTSTETIDKKSAVQAVEAVLNFMEKENIIRYCGDEGYRSKVVEGSSMLTLRTKAAGFFESFVEPGERVEKDRLLAKVSNPYDGTVLYEMYAPEDATVAFLHNEAMTYADTAAFKLIVEKK